MKQIFITILTILTLTSFGQDKNNYTHFNKLTEFISYKSSCQFNFESEGFDADVTSLTDF